jgi:outer membrane autotransporter protein
MKTHRHTTRTTHATLAALAAALALAAPAPAADYYYNSFRNNNGNTETAGHKYYTFYDGTHTLYTSPGTWFFENHTFINTNQAGGSHGDSTIYVDADGRIGESVFHGTNLYVTSSRAAAGSSQAVSIRNGGVVYLHSSTLVKINTSTDTSEGVYITDKSRFYGEDIVINANAPRVRAISLANGAGSYLSLNRATLTTTGSAAALNFAGGGIGYLVSTTIATTGPVSPGIQFNYGLPNLSYDGGSITTTGSGSPGLWAGISNVSTHVTAILKNVDIRAAAAAIEINTHLPNLLGPTPAQNSNHGLYEITLENSTVAGARGSVLITSNASSPAGVAVEIPTRVILTLKDTTLQNDLTVLSLARLQLTMTGGALDGDLLASGTTTVTATLAAGATLTGTLRLDDHATLDLTLDNSTLAGGLHATGDATATLRLAGPTARAGLLTIAPGATLTLTAAPGAPARLDGLALAGRLRLPGKLTLDTPLDLIGDAATIALANVSGGDLVLAAGLTGAATLAIENLAPAALGRSEIHLIDDQAGTTAPDTFALAGGAVDLGLAAYTLENRPDGAWLVGGLAQGNYGSAVGAMLNTHAAAAADWFHALLPVSRHLLTLRDPAAAAPRTTLWAHARTTRLSAPADGLLPAYDQTPAGLTLGASARWTASPAATFAAGIFGANTRTARDFTAATDGATAGLAAGLYFAWLHRDGWLAAATARFDAYKHEFDTHAAAAAAALRADYRSQAVGASLEFGRRLALPARHCWLEPAIQAALVTLDGARYTTLSPNPANAVPVEIASTRALQYRLRADAGCNPAGSRLGFHARLAAARTDVTGGELRLPSLTLNRRLEGWQAEALAGFTFDLGRHGHLSCDYQYTRADDHARPWSLSLGYALAW